MKSLFLCLLLVSFATPAVAVSYPPWCNQVVVSPNGKYYVVMKRTDGLKVRSEWGPVEYVICERQNKAKPIVAAKSKVTEGYDDRGAFYMIKPNAAVGVRDGDKILGRGKLKRPPQIIRVSDKGLGFVGLDLYGYNYELTEPNGSDAVIIVAPTGQTKHGIRLKSLYPGKSFDIDFGYIAGPAWLLDGWIDHQEKRLVVISRKTMMEPREYLVRYIDWDTGKVSVGPSQESRDDVRRLKRLVKEHQRKKRNLTPKQR